MSDFFQTLSVISIHHPVIVIIFVVLLIGFIGWGVSHGFITIHGKHFDMGSRRNERRILSNQIDFLETFMNTQNQIFQKQYPELDKFRTSYVVEAVKAEWLKNILKNHIKDDEKYKKEKFDKALYLVRDKTTQEMFWSEEFENVLKQMTDTIVKKLIDIRTEIQE